ncbi:YdcF family protein [Fulvivirga maritima]|uniref:YdcF family protein n=1 Tax=Fulvivirga maritima TaxID=2904247 RepID=UPI001F2F24D7|nr:YdcF family protein [Fulvivirga maritima]UII26415.1 YdcF family protein [Fulvivirga maritima]
MKTCKYLSVLLLLIICKIAFAQTEYSKVYSSGSELQDKNYYLLTLIQQMQPVSDQLKNNTALQKLNKQKIANVTQALECCSENREFIVNAFKWTDTEQKVISDALIKEWQKSSEMKDLVTELRASKAYINLDSLSDEAFLAAVFSLCVEGMNHVMDVYGNGTGAIYPSIDSAAYDIDGKSYQATIRMWSREVLNSAHKENLFFEMPLDFSLSLLYLNHRDEAARYEPMEEKENRAAIEYIPTIKWENYKYASVLVLGAGSEVYGVRLTPLGKLNLRIAAKQFLEGLAPLIIVSGGHVHPFRTPYCEAIEMKKELIAKYGIDERHIIIDPHARHTTTNLRNASRLLFAYQTNTNKPSIVTTNFDHSDYVESQRFYDRCEQELGYQPAKLLDRITPTSIEYLPSELSFQQNPLQPLDP